MEKKTSEKTDGVKGCRFCGKPLIEIESSGAKVKICPDRECRGNIRQ